VLAEVLVVLILDVEGTGVLAAVRGAGDRQASGAVGLLLELLVYFHHPTMHSTHTLSVSWNGDS
jgi:hypothetical protein